MRGRGVMDQSRFFPHLTERTTCLLKQQQARSVHGDPPSLAVLMPCWSLVTVVVLLDSTVGDDVKVERRASFTLRVAALSIASHDLHCHHGCYSRRAQYKPADQASNPATSKDTHRERLLYILAIN